MENYLCMTGSTLAEKDSLFIKRFLSRYDCSTIITTNVVVEPRETDQVMLAKLQERVKNKYGWDKRTTTKAASRNYIESLRYADENGCEWHKDVTKEAATQGHFECLRYAYENGCSMNIEITLHAAIIQYGSDIEEEEDQEEDVAAFLSVLAEMDSYSDSEEDM